MNLGIFKNNKILFFVKDLLPTAVLKNNKKR
jgi:hypothetical protein